MAFPVNGKPKKPWGGFGYLIVVVIAALAAYYLILPVGREVANVFQTLTDAFEGKR